MKRLFIVSILFLFSCHSQVGAQTVYVTKSGKKYHLENCNYVSKSSIAISLDDALKKGYTPCSICKPPSESNTVNSFDEKSQGSNNDIEKNNKMPSEKSEKVQCSALTKKGSRCKRMTTNSNGKCWQHGGN